MDWGSIAVSLVGGIGIGNIVTQYLAAQGNKKERTLIKKEQAYSNLLDAICVCCLESSNEAKRNFGLMHAKLTLVASPDIVFLSDKLRNLPSNSTEQNTLLNKLITEMRKDLGIDKGKIH